VRPYDDLNILIEGYKKPQQAFNRKLSKLTAQHIGDIWLTDTEQLGSIHLFQSSFFQEGVNFEHELRLNEVLFCIRHP
jgi:hypothetical protein